MLALGGSSAEDGFYIVFDLAGEIVEARDGGIKDLISMEAGVAEVGPCIVDGDIDCVELGKVGGEGDQLKVRLVGGVGGLRGEEGEKGGEMLREQVIGNLSGACGGRGNLCGASSAIDFAPEGFGVFYHLGGGGSAIQGVYQAGSEAAKATEEVHAGVDGIVVGGVGRDYLLKRGKGGGVRDDKLGKGDGGIGGVVCGAIA